MASYTTQLNNLKEAQKKAAVADLENTRASTLSNLQAEEAKINPTYAEKRTQTSNASKVNARNFQEYLANTGRANSGIGAQYEMGRQNSLNRSINALNTQQAADIADIARRRTDANNAYNTGLAGANAQVEANYIQNLLNQQQQQWENNMALKQFNESVRQFNLTRKDNLRGFSSGGYSSSGGRSGGSRSSGSKSVTFTDTSKNNKTQNNSKTNSGTGSILKQGASALAAAVSKTASKNTGKGTAKLASGKTAYSDYTKALAQSKSYKGGPISLQTALKKGYITAHTANGKTYYAPASTTTTKKTVTQKIVPTLYKNQITKK